MKQRITASLQSLLADRTLSGVLILFLVACLVVILFLAVSIHPSELQVVVHYTTFGTTNFYRDKWYYLLSFIVFILVMAVAHVALTYKILTERGRDMALAFAWLGVVLMCITAVTVYQVVRIAALT